MKDMPMAERLIVAADFRLDQANSLSVCERVLEFAEKLKGTGVHLKMNSALRACGGHYLIEEVHDLGLKVFADFKLCDIPETLEIDGELLEIVKPEILTVMCLTGDKAMRALKAALPSTEVLGVTVLTSLDDAEVGRMFKDTLAATVLNLASMAEGSELDGVICAPTDTKPIREQMKREMTINTPGIRPAWTVVAGDQQNQKRVMTPADAIRAGADRIVVGRPITQAKDPLDAVKRTLEEIELALATK